MAYILDLKKFERQPIYSPIKLGRALRNIEKMWMPCFIVLV